MRSSGGWGRVPVAVLLCVLLGSQPGWAQQPAPPDTAPSLQRALGGLDSGDRVRLHLPGTEPVAATFLDATGDSLRVRGDLREARAATSRIERLDVADHPVGKAALIGAGVVGAALGAFAAVNAGTDDCPDCSDAPLFTIDPLAAGAVGAVLGGLGGSGLGFLVGAAITTWDQRYPPP